MDSQRLTVDLQWPRDGLNRRFAYQAQPPGTTPDASNVRTVSVGLEGRRRGGSRPGIGKYSETQFGSGNPIRMLDSITWVDTDTIKTRIVLVANGTFVVEDGVGVGGGVAVGPGGVGGGICLPGTPLPPGVTLLPPTTFSSFAATTGGSNALNPNKNLQSASRNQILYIADHADDPAQSANPYYPKKFNPVTNALTQWTATDGTLPLGCNTICAWRDRLVLAGGTTNPYGVFLSRQSDPDDWDFSEEDTGAAVNLALADAGQIGDVVTCLAPHTDNCLIIGCHTSLWILRNDPGYGGILDNLSQQIGVVDRGAYCTTPDGLMVFLSRDGLYSIPASCTAARFPESLSREKIPNELLAIDRDTHSVSMAFDVRDRGIHIYVTPIAAESSPARGWFFDWENKSYWPVDLASTDLEPFVMHERENFSDVHSPVIFGCRDGYVRRFRGELSQDDGLHYDSHVLIGPISDPAGMRDTILTDLRGKLDLESGDVRWEILRGDTAESATNASVACQGTFRPGSRATQYPRVKGEAIYVRLSNKEHGRPWAWESGKASIEHVGRSR